MTCRLTALVCALAFFLSLCACGTEGDHTSSEITFETSEESSLEETLAISEEADIQKPVLSFTGLPYNKVYAQDAANLHRSNPWKAASEYTALPVIEKSRLMTKSETLATLSSIAGKLELTELDIPVFSDGVYTGTYNEGVVIQAYNNGLVRIFYVNGGKALPPEYSFDGASYDAAASRLEWLSESYSEVFGIDSPVCCVEPTYDESGKAFYSAFMAKTTFVYQKGADETEDMLNYFLQPLWFEESVTNYVKNNTLGTVSAYLPSKDRVVNEYPVISAEEAKKLLLSGKCHSPAVLNVGLLLKEDGIKHTELVYNRSDTGTCMPFWCFWISADGAYYPCYVPAVEEKHLDTSAIPGWK